MSAELGWCGPMTRACVMAVCFAAAARLLYLARAKVASRRCSCCRRRTADFYSSAVFADLRQKIGNSFLLYVYYINPCMLPRETNTVFE